jgi:predicted nucleic acid-binding protein
MILLDTNVVSEPLRPGPHSAVQRWLDEQNQSDLFLCAPVLAELHHGVLRLPSGARQDRLAEWVRHVEENEFVDRILPFDRAASHEFGRVLTLRRRLGRETGPMDALIAAIALTHGAVLATRNIDDFSGVGLDIVNPFESD